MYIKTFVLSISVSLIVIISLNYLVDPYGSFWINCTQEVNCQKLSSANMTRTTKPWVASRAAPEVLLVGNSRVDIGLNPESLSFSGSRAYNLGLPGASLKLQYNKATEVINSTKNIKKVIIGLDFRDFLTTKDRLISLSQAEKNNISLIPFTQSSLIKNLKLIFTLDTLKSSILTLLSQENLNNSINRFGFNNGYTYKKVIKNEGIKVLFNQNLRLLKKRLTEKTYLITSPDKGLFNPKLIELNNFLSYLISNNIEVSLFISPYHISYLQVINESNLLKEFFIWKEQLINILKNTNNSSISAWDFSSINNITNEKTSFTRNNTEMHWYWEPTHYKPSLGDEILKCIISGNNNKIGIPLTAETFTSEKNKLINEIEKNEENWINLKKELSLN